MKPSKGLSRPKGQNVRSLSQLWQFVAPYRWRLLPGAVSLLITTAAMLVIPKQAQKILDTALHTGDVSALNTAVFYLFVTILVMVAGIWLRTLTLRYTGMLVVADIRKALYAHVLKLDMPFFEKNRTGEILSRMLADVGILKESIATHIPFLVRGFFVTFGSLAALVYSSVKLTGLIVAALPFIVMVAVLLGKRWRTFARDIQDKTADISTQVEESVAGLKTVQAFTQEPREEQNLNNFVAEEVRLSKRLIISTAAFFSFNIFAGFGVAALVAWWGGYMVMHGAMSAGELMAYFLYLAFLADGFNSLSNFWPALQSAAGATERVFEILHTKPQIFSSPQAQTHLPEAKGGRALRFEDVSFRYPSRPEAYALQHITLQVNKGETVAIVGPSGAGKSTLFQLALRFYELDSGSILLDSTPCSQMDLATLRRHIGLVAQEATIFSTSILENIRYGKPEAPMEEVIAAATAAHAHEFVTALPEGYNTQVGERGMRLSGGQRQRVAIARTILMNPDVLLLDEATSHLDAESEQKVQQAFEQMRQNRTTLVIAHRLATVRSANRIVLLNHGRIEAEGTHEELLQKSELYNRLATLQFMNT